MVSAIAIVMEVQRFTGSSSDWTGSGSGWTGSGSVWTGSGSGLDRQRLELDRQRLGLGQQRRSEIWEPGSLQNLKRNHIITTHDPASHPKWRPHEIYVGQLGLGGHGLWVG